eukprot:comp17544_c0_seq1/m.17121 comp17544_c0_seq1/g.17121  ORF comp17544_c0_seq1/g.17121 comp17544_c0_seq1/m.17121 type:complete len:278 (-) comp17544_c0_seq1:1122-1955(-)
MKTAFLFTLAGLVGVSEAYVAAQRGGLHRGYQGPGAPNGIYAVKYGGVKVLSCPEAIVKYCPGVCGEGTNIAQDVLNDVGGLACLSCVTSHLDVLLAEGCDKLACIKAKENMCRACQRNADGSVVNEKECRRCVIANARDLEQAGCTSLSQIICKKVISETCPSCPKGKDCSECFKIHEPELPEGCTMASLGIKDTVVEVQSKESDVPVVMQKVEKPIFAASDMPEADLIPEAYIPPRAPSAPVGERIPLPTLLQQLVSSAIEASPTPTQEPAPTTA